MCHLAFRTGYRLSVNMDKNTFPRLSAIRAVALGGVRDGTRRRIRPMLGIGPVNDFPRGLKVLSQNVFHYRRTQKTRLCQCLSEEEVAEFVILR